MRLLEKTLWLWFVQVLMFSFFVKQKVISHLTFGHLSQVGFIFCPICKACLSYLLCKSRFLFGAVFCTLSTVDEITRCWMFWWVYSVTDGTCTMDLLYFNLLLFFKMDFPSLAGVVFYHQINSQRISGYFCQIILFVQCLIWELIIS